jgi:DNA polymerase III subunit delta
MKLNVEALQRHLEKNLLPVYFIHGDEPLLGLESMDLIHHKAKTLGFTECIKLDASRNDLDLQSLTELTQNYSLFGDKRRIQLSISEKLNEDVEAWLNHFLEVLPQVDDSILIVKAPKFSAAQLKKKWLEKLDRLGAVITLWEVEREHLPRWLFQRAEAKGVKLTREAVQMLAEQVEGNLLAAAQVIEKLAVLMPGVMITPEQLQPLLAADARYDVFDLSESVLDGDLARALKILAQLQSESFEATIILWALSKELRILADLTAARREELPGLYRRHNVWEKRQIHYHKALQRLNHATALKLLADAQKIDLAIKGLGSGNHWHALKHLITGFCVRIL